MRLTQGLHLAYCTNIHRGETWPQTLANLQAHTLAVRDQVSPGSPYAIGLRLGHLAARELSEPGTLLEFQRWLEHNNCYVFTINGFPYGRFHGGPVKLAVYSPDWTTPERLAYTQRLFDLLATLLPKGVAGSVSTLPGAYKKSVRDQRAHGRAMRDNLWRCVEYVSALGERSGRELMLGLEPEPLCWLETAQEVVDFFAAMREDRPNDSRLDRHLGVTYDTCHLAVEYEEPGPTLERFQRSGVRVAKLHLSSALKVRPTPAVRQALAAFVDEVYLHQVLARGANGAMTCYEDLPAALLEADTGGISLADQWRIHFHVPLHSQPARFFDPAHDPAQLDFASALDQGVFDTTTDHLEGVLDFLGACPALCQHLEIETYTWEVLPPELRNRRVTEQITAEYAWTLAALARRGFTPLGA